MYIYKIYFHKVGEKVEANYHRYEDGYFRLFKGNDFEDRAREVMVAEFYEEKIVGWRREGSEKDKAQLGFIRGGKK